tara:strand:+ start:11967 stop:12605 length:639 start_codon:yes stop_codon:yes gene_type:complete
MLLPWSIRRRLLNRIFNYNIAPSAKIGFSVVLCRKLTMAPCSNIRHLTFIGIFEELQLGNHAIIGHLNWISGMPLSNTNFFKDEPDRYPSVTLEEHSAMTSRHIIDCSNHVTIGAFSTLAGYRTQILSHSIDVTLSRQMTEKVTIGKYCFVGTSCVFLKGSILPDYSVLGAGSVLTTAEHEPFGLFSGVPAKRVRELDKNLLYFTRRDGFIH